MRGKGKPMSLNQAFLKLYGEKTAEPLSPDRPAEEDTLSRRVPAGELADAADELNISLRVDRGETSVSRRFAAMREDRQRNVFSLEEERRRRNPCRKDDAAEAGPAAEESVLSRTDPPAPETRIEPAAEPCPNRTRPEPNEPEVIPLRAAAPSEPPSAELPNGTAWCDETLESAEVVSMPTWPATCREIFRRGATEFAQLTDVVSAAMRKGNKILGFGGWGNGIGVSTLLLGILVEMLYRRQRVLLLDANFQHPGLAELLDVRAGATWENLSRSAEPDRPSGLVRVETDPVPFWLLPLSRESLPEAVAASCRKSWFRSFLELTEPFDLVLIDHGSLRSGNPREKVLELLRFGCDGYFMVTDARSPRRGEEAGLPTISDECRLPCFGVIENFT